MKRARGICENSNLKRAREMCDGSGSGAREVTLEAKHKIFLSHSGAQKNFVEQLCVDLERCDRYPFFDKRWHSLPIGKHFPDRIFKAIQQCQVGVLILSKEFFTRTKWPMLELEAMVESKKQNLELVIMPVFLGISREECRNHKRWESRWLELKQEDGRINLEKWKEALLIFGGTNGLIYNEVLGEVKFREEIVKAICERVRPKTRWDDSHVQGRSRLCQVIYEKVERIKVSEKYGARVVGLYGVGGLGKTTMCKALCNNYFEEFQGRVAHVELESRVELELMHEVLRKLTDTRHEVLARFNKGECITHLKEKLDQHDVFLAIDNVSHTIEAFEQTRVYLRAGYTHGSVVIVTARSKKVLTGVGIAEENCMQMPKLDASEARSLFLYQVPVPDEINANDEDHIMHCVEVCRFQNADKTDFDYLPLALKLFGIQLGTVGYDPKLWVEQLPDTSNELMLPVFEILRRSFDALREEDKLLFVDAVLYFPRRWNSILLEINININIFEWLSMVHGKTVEHVKLRLQELQRNSVIEELGESIGVHDLWREFAKEETKAGELECRRWVYATGDEKSGFDDNEPSGNRWGKLQRMCFTVESSRSICVNVTMLTNLQYYSNVTVLHLKYSIDMVKVLDLSALRCLKSLVLVKLHSEFPVFLYKEMEVCSGIKLYGIRMLKSLRLLVWANDHISSACMEDIAHLTSLQSLSLTYNHADQLPDLSNLESLQVVQFSTRGRISKISGLNKLTKLKQLTLRFWSECTICACYGIGNLTALEELEIKGRVEVEEVFNLRKLTNLQRLSMDHCESIKEIIGLDNLVALKYFCLCCSKREPCELGGLRSLPRISKLTNLQELVISYQSITTLEGFSDAISLQKLNARHCFKLRELPDMAKLTKLQYLYISWSCVQAIPGLGELVALQWLEAQHCSELSELPNMAKLTNLVKLDISWSCVQAIPGLGELVALQWLEAQHCSKLSELPDMAKLTNLQYLYISWSCVQAIPGLGELVALQWLEAQHCSKLSELPDMAKLTNLAKLDISWSCVQAIPGLGELVTLQSLEAQHCSELSELPDMAKLTNLQYLYISWSCVQAIPGLGELVALRFLEAQHCSELSELPDMAKLTNLRSLDISSSCVQALPGLGELVALRFLEAQHCSELSELPDMAKLTNLRSLDISSSCVQALPGLGELVALRFLEAQHCSELSELPDMAKLTKLRSLDISWSCVQAIPGLGELVALRRLEAPQCSELCELPDMAKLTKLRSLDISSSCVQAIPGLGEVVGLKVLVGQHCSELSDIPDLQ